MIISYNTRRGTIELPCPKCESNAEIEVPAFLRAINRHERFMCSDCHQYFRVKVELLDPPARTSDTADLGQTCPRCAGKGGYKVGIYHEMCDVCAGSGHV